MKKKACIYCRVSTSDQNNDRQESDLKQLAERYNYKIVGVEKETVSGKSANRPVRDKVINLARKGEFDIILVTEISRWGRSTIDVIQTLEKLASYNVSLISQTGISFDLSTSEGRFLSTLLAAFAELERDFISERVRSGLRRRKEQGKKLGRGGTLNKKTEKLRNKILKMHKEGSSASSISKVLNLDSRTVKKVIDKFAL